MLPVLLLVFRGLREPDAASRAAIGSKFGKIAVALSDARQPQLPRADRTSRLHRVVITNRSHQISECQHGYLGLLFRLRTKRSPDAVWNLSKSRTFKRPSEIQTHV